MRRGGKRLDIVGKRYGRLAVVSFSEVKNQRTFWLCKCDCGKEKIVNGHLLSSGNTRSCGCLKEESRGKSSIVHGLTRTPLWNSWIDMRERCKRKNHHAYKDYGGRGIIVCEGWNKSFVSFMNDMGEKPSSHHSIDRIENNGGYTCGHCDECIANEWKMNCKWSTTKEQMINRRSTKWIPFNGQVKTMTEWAEYFNIPCSLISQKLKTKSGSMQLISDCFGLRNIFNQHIQSIVAL